MEKQGELKINNKIYENTLDKLFTFLSAVLF